MILARLINCFSEDKDSRANSETKLTCGGGASVDKTRMKAHKTETRILIIFIFSVRGYDDSIIHVFVLCDSRCCPPFRGRDERP
jgi:hypothetical protein